MNTDAIYEDLKMVQKAKWTWRKERFDQVKLLRHPEVERRATDPADGQKLLDALFGLLNETRDQMERRRQDEGAEESPVAMAAAILLRLDQKNDRRSLRLLQNEVAEVWKGDRGNPVTGNTVRLHYEKDHILRPFAHEVCTFLERSSGPGGSTGKEEGMLRHLRQVEEARLKSIPREGALEVRTDREMLDVLRGVNELASESLHAVDRTPIDHWFEEPPLCEYLSQQLELVSSRGLRLERIYLVRRATLANEAERDRLVEFVESHDGVRATILLCRVEAAGKIFDEERGMILADSEGEPMAVTGKLKDGEIGEAFLYTREQAHIEKLREQYRHLRSRILTRHHDDKLRGKLGLPARVE